MPPTDPIKTKLDPVFTGQKPETEAAPATAYNVLANQKYVPNQDPISVTLNTPNNQTVNPKSMVRTYKSDLESAIMANHISSINIAMAENEKMRNKIKDGEEVAVPTSNYSKSKIIILISFILLFAGGLGLSIAFLINQNNPSTVNPTTEIPSLITTEYRDELNTNIVASDKFLITLSGKLNDIQIPTNSMYNTLITAGANSSKQLISSTVFVSLAKFKMPDLMKRSLLPDYMVGMYSFGKNIPFIIFKTSSFENTYPAMLTWEKDLEQDLKVLFRLTGYAESGGIAAALTPTTAKSFEDSVIINKDVRQLRNDAGQIILLYGIVDRETVIITTSDAAFKEIINRLNAEKSLKR